MHASACLNTHTAIRDIRDIRSLSLASSHRLLSPLMALDAELPNVRGRIVQLYLRPSTAEGNPFHKALTREPYPPGAEVPLTSNGLEQSFEWHRDAQVISRGTLKRATDRAVLCQSVQHYSFLQQSFPQTRESLCGVAAFGENALIDGLDSSLLCIGDIFHVVRGNADNVVATLQVSNPRRPCYKVPRSSAQAMPIEVARTHARCVPICRST